MTRTTSRLCLLACLAACRSGVGASTTPVTAETKVVVNPIDVQRVLIDTPAPVQAVAVPGAELPPLKTQRTTVGLVMTSRFRCDIARALELREYEGSILGSHGIDVAVTYFVPILHQEKCEPTETSNEYQVAIAWERRTDTEWTIAVPGYRGSEDRVPGTALFARRLSGHQADAATQGALRSMTVIGDHPQDSMTNAGHIQSVKTARDAASGDVLVSVTVRYANDCEAETPWVLAPVLWAPGADGTAHIWTTLERPSHQKACPGFAQLSPPPLATSHLRVAAPSGASSLAIVVPNMARDRDLPVFSTQLPLR